MLIFNDYIMWTDLLCEISINEGFWNKNQLMGLSFQNVEDLRKLSFEKPLHGLIWRSCCSPIAQIELRIFSCLWIIFAVLKGKETDCKIFKNFLNVNCFLFEVHESQISECFVVWDLLVVSRKSRDKWSTCPYLFSHGYKTIIRALAAKLEAMGIAG